MIYRKINKSYQAGCFTLLCIFVFASWLTWYSLYHLPQNIYIFKVYTKWVHSLKGFYGFGYVVACPFVISWIISFIIETITNKIYQNHNQYDFERNKKRSFAFVGTSTGLLNSKQHQNSLAANQALYLTKEDCCMNFIAFGGIGSGKTAYCLLPLIYSLTHNWQKEPVGGLVFDVKGDFGGQFKQMIPHRQEVITVGLGDGEKGFDLLAGLTPDMAATFLNSALILGNSGTGNDKFWTDSATALIKNVLGVLQHAPNAYNLADLYKFIFIPKYAAEIEIKAIKGALDSHDEMNQRKLEVCLSYIHENFEANDEKVKQSIKATISTILEPFQNPELSDRFCTGSQDVAINIYEILKGKFVLVDLPIPTWGIGAKVIYTMIKLRFFNMVQERVIKPYLNQTQPCLFVCDEYQDVISVSSSGLSDLSFWDKSRSAKCIGLISSQSYSSFRAACGGQRDLTDTVLQNFRQKVCFRTEDVETINYFKTLGGNVERSRRVATTSQHKGESTTSYSTQYYRETVIDEQLIRSLRQGLGLGMFSIEGESIDDVLCFQPYWEILEKQRQQKRT